MNAREAFTQAQATNQIAARHQNGYSAYLREHEDDNTFSLAICQGMMPPHTVEPFETADDMFAFLEAHAYDQDWIVEEAE